MTAWSDEQMFGREGAHGLENMSLHLCGRCNHPLGDAMDSTDHACPVSGVTNEKGE